MSYIQIRINGRGNAWPVILGQDHPFYKRGNYEDMANSSCSIVKSTNSSAGNQNVEWELMVDAGHGAVQHLLKYRNRIPEALFLTHPHIDHTLGADWIIQSYYKTYKKPYPLYATFLCWEKTKQAFPHLETMVDFKELIPYQTINVNEAGGGEIKLVPFPVYHGKSAEGAVMFLFVSETKSGVKKLLITGDLLCPLLRSEDEKLLSDIELLIADANNRYPYPKSNHWSILNGLNNETSEILSGFIHDNSIKDLLEPHIKDNRTDYHKLFEYFLNHEWLLSKFQFSIFSFIKKYSPQRAMLLHYSGSEDEKYYNQKRLSEKEFESWLHTISKKYNISTKLELAYVSQHTKFANY